MAAEVRRDSFKTFWDKYSNKPDTNSMMLNQTANDLEASDRADILSSLPLLTNKDVVDIGAGIGRFTTVLAETARWVHSTDFIESFIAKNQERNAHLGNISYQIGDAVNLQMEEKSVDLVFTNWLMMYLSDREVIEFLFNAMRWLRADGYMHLRESCSEPSTGRSKSSTMHSNTDSNPTHYRFSSLYIKVPIQARELADGSVLFSFFALYGIVTMMERCGDLMCNGAARCLPISR
ncbi:methyltransferase domain protein [Ancylostoma caninum]|uniref:phosphoethanolamine N-methyltransferase n=1 Tax=Ancylostoma caninum TaxID=29170 RepID=A0A368H928_ANCCA|nr:methyltransferase domain protein [Ancylostoma caninum]